MWINRGRMFYAQGSINPEALERQPGGCHSCSRKNKEKLFGDKSTVMGRMLWIPGSCYTGGTLDVFK